LQQLKELDAARRQELAEGKHPLVAQLARLRAIGPKGAWVLVVTPRPRTRMEQPCRAKASRAQQPTGATHAVAHRRQNEVQCNGGTIRSSSAERRCSM
jgi:hypothetical protein